MLKSHTLNKVGIVVDFTTDKAIFSMDILKAILHEFGLNCRHVGAIALRLEQVECNASVITEIGKKFGTDISYIYTPILHND